MTRTLKIGSKVAVQNYHGEYIPATRNLGVGYVRQFFTDCGEQRAVVWFTRAQTLGAWPVEMLKVLP